MCTDTRNFCYNFWNCYTQHLYSWPPRRIMENLVRSSIDRVTLTCVLILMTAATRRAGQVQKD